MVSLARGYKSIVFFVLCEIGSVCFKKSLSGDVEIFDGQIHYEKSDIVNEAHVRTAEKLLLSGNDGMCARQIKLFLDAPVRLCCKEFLADHVTHFLSTRSVDPSLYGMGKALPLVYWL